VSRNRGAGGNGTLEVTGQPEFMPFGADNKVEDTSAGEANQGFKKLGYGGRGWGAGCRVSSLGVVSGLLDH
jgi:hypothetical protein